MLTRLIYHSENHLGLGVGSETLIAGLNDLLEVCVRNNSRNGLTGALLFDGLWFVQILEGERELITGTMRKIFDDRRHAAVNVMYADAIGERLFGNWWMGAAALPGKDVLTRHHILRFDPKNLTGSQVLAVATDLAGQGLNRHLAA